MRYENVSDEFIKSLKSLGCGFRINSAPICTDPEKTILECLNLYWDANSLFFMVFSLLKHGNITHLINVNRLIKLAKLQNLENDKICLLIAMSEELSDAGFESFKAVKEKLYSENLVMKNPPESETDEYMIKTWGENKYLNDFGVKVRNFYLEPEKKFFSKNTILKSNKWLSLRALVGVNYRADIIYLKLSNLCETAYQAHKKLGCTLNSAYTIWNSLDDIETVRINER